MNILISLALLLFLVAVIAWRSVRANRMAARRAREKELARQSREREVLARLEKIKKKSDLDFAKSVVDKDPERAARVVARMMKKG